MNIMNFINKVDLKTKQFLMWWGDLTYEKKFGIILLSIFVGVPILFWTTLIIPVVAFGAFILAVKVFQYGKKEDDIIFFVPASMFGAVTIGLSWAWFAMLIK